MVGLAKHYRQFPDQLTQEQIRAYLLHLQERGLSSSSQNVAVSGLKFFYQPGIDRYSDPAIREPPQLVPLNAGIRATEQTDYKQ
jgi:hypothetical protein